MQWRLRSVSAAWVACAWACDAPEVPTRTASLADAPAAVAPVDAGIEPPEPAASDDALPEPLTPLPLPPIDPVDPVFARYPRDPQLSRLAYVAGSDCPKLSRVATPQDVAEGRAIFTLAGLGRARRVVLHERTPSANWRVLKRYPFRYNTGDVGYRRRGTVCQAEELLVDGEWRRYVGFAMDTTAAVVPAHEIDLDLPEGRGPIYWWSVEGSLDLGFTRPALPKLTAARDSVYRITSGPALVQLFVRNRRATPQTVPARWFVPGREGEPAALPTGIDVVLEWAAYNPREQDDLYPRSGSGRPGARDEHGDFTVLKRAAVEHVAPTGSVTLRTSESTAIGALDLRQLFGLQQPGFYSYHLTVDPSAAGLDRDAQRTSTQYSIDFEIGPKPRTLTLQELNAEIPALGGRANVQRVRALIETSLPATRPVTAEAAQAVPQFSRAPVHGGNRSLGASTVEYLLAANEEEFERLDKLDRAVVAAVLEQRMLQETEFPAFRLLLASVAASAGSRAGALHLLESLERTDYDFAYDTRTALAATLDRLAKDPPAWIVELAQMALADDRYATKLGELPAPGPFGLRGIRRGSGRVRLSYVAAEPAGLPWALARAKPKSVLPFLLERIEREGCERGFVLALAALEESAAVPALIHCLKEGLAYTRVLDTDPTHMAPDDVRHALDGLAARKVTEIVPWLLDHLEFVEVIEALDTIGDARAAERLNALVAAGGKVRREGREILGGLASERVIAARIALVRLIPGDAVRRYCALLVDPAFGEFARRDVAARMHALRDPKLIPCLENALQTDPSGVVVNAVIDILSYFPHRAAVEALIAGLSADFEGKNDWKRALTPAMFRENAAKSLERLTGQALGTAPEPWRVWWQREGRDAFAEGVARTVSAAE